MSEPREPSGEPTDNGAPQQLASPRRRAPSLSLAHLRAGEGRVVIGLAGTLLVIALVATGPLWAPLLPWAAEIAPPPDARTTRVEAPPPPQRQPAEAAASPGLPELDRRVAALEARSAAPASDVAEIRREVARLTVSSAELATRIEAVDKAVHSQAAGDPTDLALVLALLQVRDAIEAGRPFAAAYEALAALAQARPEIAASAAPLAEPATAGLPGRVVLANRLRELTDAIASAKAPAKADAEASDWAEEAWRRLVGLVTIRRIDGVGQDQAGTGPAAAVNVALQALAGGDLEVAVGALDKLTGAPAEAARPWLRMAKDRLAAEAALQRIEALLVARLGTPANAPTGSGPPR